MSWSLMVAGFQNSDDENRELGCAWECDRLRGPARSGGAWTLTRGTSKSFASGPSWALTGALSTSLVASEDLWLPAWGDLLLRLSPHLWG